MFDETNNTQEQELSLPDNLFENDDSLPEQDFEEESDFKGSETIKIKYNGEERDITLDEARILAQKGMNYDHVVAERDTKYKRELDFLDSLAEKNGMTRSQYIMSQGTNPEEERSQETSDAREMARKQLRRITDSVGFSGPWSNLFRSYPELSRNEAYSMLSERVKEGLTPLEAYQERLIKEKENQIRITSSNNAARIKSVGSIEGDENFGRRDEFLEGFLIEE